jgi:type IV pilus assembly protein PilA
MKKGFTLVEILAVIVILAIVAAIVIPSIDRFITKARDSAYDVQIDSIIASVKNWEADHPESLPLNNGDQYIVYLSELKSGNYIDQKLINPRTRVEFSNDLTVTIKNVNGRHTYEVDDAE